MPHDMRKVQTGECVLTSVWKPVSNVLTLDLGQAPAPSNSLLRKKAVVNRKQMDGQRINRLVLQGHTVKMGWL